MVQLASFVFLRHSREDIVEISLVACSKEHLLATEKGKFPRVLHKVTLCVNPEQEIHESVDKNVNNEMVQEEKLFDESTVKILKLFLQRLQSPTCLVAHDGKGCVFPILKRNLQKLNAQLPDETYCFDSLALQSLQWPSQEQASPANQRQFTFEVLYKQVRTHRHVYFHPTEWDALALLKSVIYLKDHFVMCAEEECIKFGNFSGTADSVAVSLAPDHPSSSTIPVHDCNNLVEPNENEDAQDSGTRSDNRRVEEVFQEDDDGDKLLASVALHNLI